MDSVTMWTPPVDTGVGFWLRHPAGQRDPPGCAIRRAAPPGLGHLAPLAALEGGVHSTSNLAYLTRVNLSPEALTSSRPAPTRGPVCPNRSPSSWSTTKSRSRPLSPQLAARAFGATREVRKASTRVRAGSQHRARCLRRRRHSQPPGTARHSPTFATVTGMSASPYRILAARGKEYVPILRAAIRTGSRDRDA